MIRAARRSALLLLALAAWLLSPPARVAAQESAAPVGHRVHAGGGLERYLRDLQLLGRVPVYPWTVRPFSPGEISRIAPRSDGHPWANRHAFADTLHRMWARPVPLEASAWYNSGFPYGYNDGPVWAGAGVTMAIAGGAAARLGPIFIRIAPVAFWAQNGEAPLVDTGVSEGRRVFADPDSPTTIDLPQRFGDGAYARLDPGESLLRLDLPWLAAGVSTETQQWGPGWDQPLILGNNAAGYPHAFVGTNRPLDLWIGKVYGRVEWGLLEPSDYAPPPRETRRRFMSGLVASFSPRGMEGLEIGGSRFFHSPWVGRWPSPRQFAKPFESLLKVGLGPNEESRDGSDADNQLASAFARWTFPRSGLEFYGEFAREDHSWDLRDFVVEPDHNSAYMLGLGKAWTSGDDVVSVVRAEAMNALVTQLARVRGQTRFYRHTRMNQGHTNLGQVLGGAAAYGGASARVSFQRYDPGGGWSADLMRWVHAEEVPRRGGELPGDRVIHSLGVHRLATYNGWDVGTGVTGLIASGGSDETRFNLNLTMGVRAPL